MWYHWKDGGVFAKEYLEQFEDYVYSLRLFAGYEYKNCLKEQPFVYQDSGSPELRRLRDELNLDEIAGDGTQWERLLRLNHWLHTTVRHDGNSRFPYPRGGKTGSGPVLAASHRIPSHPWDEREAI